MKRYVQLYLMFLSKHLKTLMVYRADFVIGIVCLLLSFALARFSIWAIFQRTQNIDGWVKGEIIFAYGYNLMVSGVAWLFFNQAWGLRDAVTSGGFIKYKIRPLNPLFHFFAESFDIRSIATIALGVLTLHAAAGSTGFHWTPPRTGELVLLTLMSAALFAGMIVLASAMAFWLTISNPLLGFLASIHGVAYFPLGIYGRMMGTLLSTLLPIAFVSFYPCSILMGKTPSVVPLYAMLGIIVVLWMVAVRLWLKGVQRYELPAT